MRVTAGLSVTSGLRRAARNRRAAVAVVDRGHSFTWEEHAARVARLAAVFRSLGLKAGDRVAILADSGHLYLETYQAVPWAGGILAPVNSRFAFPEMREMLEDALPGLLLVDAAHAAIAAELVGSLPVRPILLTAEEAEQRMTALPPMPDTGRGGDDVACLFYTGGTTGRAKGVALTHAGLVLNALNTTAPLGMGEGMAHLHCGPLFHMGAGARVFSTTLHGGRHVVLPRFDAGEVLRAIEGEGVTHAVMVPAMVTALLDHPDLGQRDLSSLRVVSYGASPMPVALVERLIRCLPQVGLVQSYGQTELSPVATMLPARDHVPGSPRLRSAGQVLPNVELRIADPEDREVPAGTVGEVQVRGPTVMKGYWNRPEETARALRGGWMHTGDAGYLDEEGYLYVVDRLKDMIISGGENVYSAEVENAIHDHPAVLECAVFGVPHPRWGEAVHATVVTRPGHQLTEDALLAHCRARIAGYKCPKSVEISSEPLPRSPTGKIRKTELRDARHVEPAAG
nr:long-chain fatty acid--CoA ligase [Roseococcus sp. MDT2-1-1]